MSAGHSPERSVGFLMQDVSRLLRRNFNRRVRELGLTQAQWQALAQLSRREGINQATLAEMMEVQPITLARLIDRLEEAKLVERRPDPADRRAVRLYLTEGAAPVIGEMWAQAGATRAEALEGVPEDMQDVLIEALQRMRANLIARDSDARKACVTAANELPEATEE